jgi:hypothetical protein
MNWEIVIRMCLNILKPVQKELLKDFATYTDLEAWFDLHKELQLLAPNLCDDYSRESRALAEVDGYFLSCELLADGICYQTRIFPEGFYHIGNMAIVTQGQSGGEECWYVDLNWSKLIKLCDFTPGGKY